MYCAWGECPTCPTLVTVLDPVQSRGKVIIVLSTISWRHYTPNSRCCSSLSSKTQTAVSGMKSFPHLYVNTGALYQLRRLTGIVWHERMIMNYECERLLEEAKVLDWEDGIQLWASWIRIACCRLGSEPGTSAMQVLIRFWLQLVLVIRNSVCMQHFSFGINFPCAVCR
jgi:hypothetical protein